MITVLKLCEELDVTPQWLNYHRMRKHVPQPQRVAGRLCYDLETAEKIREYCRMRQKLKTMGIV